MIITSIHKIGENSKFVDIPEPNTKKSGIDYLVNRIYEIVYFLLAVYFETDTRFHKKIA